MKPILHLLLCGSLLGGLSANAQEGSESRRDAPQLDLQLQPKPKGFPPPFRKLTRRSAASKMPPMVLKALSPTSGSPATISLRPRLFWYQSLPTPGNLLLVLRDRQTRKIDPEIHIRAELPAGTQSLDLPEELALKPGEIYLWTLTYKPTPDVLNDVTVRGEIHVLPNAEALQTEVAEFKDPQKRIEWFAAQGAWYDLLREVHDLETDDENDSVAEMWRDLLRRGGISAEELAAENAGNP